MVAPSAAPRLRVATFNVNFGVADHIANFEALEAIDADVVLLQEITAASEDRFVDALSAQYPHIEFRDCCRAGGLGVLSKYPIVSEVYLESETGWFPAWLVTVDGPLGRVQLLDVHLRPPVSDSGSWVQGYFSTRDDRRAEIEGFWSSVDESVPTIVAGDFNEGADGRAVEFLADKGMRSALAQVDPRADTWHWPLRVGELTSMLDHIVYDTRLALLHAEVRTQGASDHYPVFADFILAPS
ncbi:MAG: endonuclease/exonuclease/phosphatase family protein [Nannocystaceae bacterium]|nr:endonuclease/exonuclease/phosphatase family protein [bacterium]